MLEMIQQLTMWTNTVAGMTMHYCTNIHNTSAFNGIVTE